MKTDGMDAQTRAIREMTRTQRRVRFRVLQEYGRGLKADMKARLAQGAKLDDLGKRYGELVGQKPFARSTIHRWVKGFGFPTRSKSC